MCMVKLFLEPPVVFSGVTRKELNELERSEQGRDKFAKPTETATMRGSPTTTYCVPRKVMGLTLHALLGVEHSLAQVDAL